MRYGNGRDLGSTGKKGSQPGEEGQWQGIIGGPDMSCRINCWCTSPSCVHFEATYHMRPLTEVPAMHYENNVLS